MLKSVYIHYGAKRFDPNIGFPVKYNRPTCRVKPVGGLWASRVGDDNTWKDWCEANNFRTCDERNSFCFTLSDGANVKYLSTKGDLINQAWFRENPIDVLNSIDYQMLIGEGIDALEVTNIEELYYTLYGWDCNSIVVLNPNIVREIGRCTK